MIVVVNAGLPFTMEEDKPNRNKSHNTRCTFVCWSQVQVFNQILYTCITITRSKQPKQRKHYFLFSLREEKKKVDQLIDWWQQRDVGFKPDRKTGWRVSLREREERERRGGIRIYGRGLGSCCMHHSMRAFEAQTCLFLSLPFPALPLFPGLPLFLLTFSHPPFFPWAHIVQYKKPVLLLAVPAVPLPYLLLYSHYLFINGICSFALLVKCFLLFYMTYSHWQSI